MWRQPWRLPGGQNKGQQRPYGRTWLPQVGSLTAAASQAYRHRLKLGVACLLNISSGGHAHSQDGCTAMALILMKCMKSAVYAGLGELSVDDLV